MTAGPALACRQLIKQKGHFAAALAGVAFAVSLMLSQIALRDSLLLTGIRLYQHMRADIFMTSWEYQFQQSAGIVPRRRFAEVLAVEGVASCAPVQIGWLTLENPQNHEQEQIVMVGFNPNDDPWRFDDQKINFRALTEPQSLIFDGNSRKTYGPLPAMFLARGKLPVSASHHRASIVGLLYMGPGFSNHGYVFTSDTSFDNLVVEGGSPLPSIGAIRMKPGADRDALLRRLRSRMPPDVQFTDYPTFLENEKEYWLKGSPIGFVFTAALILALVVGAVVVYQILYSDVTNHLAEYATMKAMGYSDRKLFLLVILQSIYVSVLGFIPGALIANLMATATHNATKLPVDMNITRLSEVYALTFIMCVGSASLAMQALKAADPAEIF